MKETLNCIRAYFKLKQRVITIYDSSAHHKLPQGFITIHDSLVITWERYFSVSDAGGSEKKSMQVVAMKLVAQW